MNETIARLNIEHYCKLLTEEMDETKRQMILRLLSEEEAKLKAIEESNRAEEIRKLCC